MGVRFRFLLPLLSLGCSLASMSLAAAIEPPPSLPRPKWVTMVDRRAADERLAGYVTPQEIKLEIVAENPALSRAGKVCFGIDGNLLVLEWSPEAEARAKEIVETVAYRDGSRRAITRLSTPIKDVVKSVRDPGSKDAFEKAKVILEGERISALVPNGQWLYTAGAGAVTRYRRSRNDGPYDIKEPVAHGFGGFGLRPPMGLSFDFDGRLVIAVGAGSHDVEGSDGSRARVGETGAIFRCRPDGSRLEVLAIGLCHPQGDPAFDNEFHLMQVDGADAQESSKRRILHIAEGSDFGLRLSPGSHSECQDSARQHCLQGLPGEMAPVYAMPGSASGGSCVLNVSSFPPFMQGLLLCTDSARNSVRAIRLDRRDSSFAATEEFDLIRSNDRLFQPWQVLAGPDGAIYVTDRPAPSASTDQAAAKRDGRLYRVSWAGGPAHPALPTRALIGWSRFASLGGSQLVDSLGAVDFSDRQLAQQELIRRGSVNKAALIKVAGNAELSVSARILAAGTLTTMWDDEVKNLLVKLATDDDAIMRRLAAECLGRNSSRGDSTVQEALLHVLGDAEPASRRSVALAMAHVAAPDAAENLATALSFDNGDDHYLRDGLVRALESLGKPGLDRLLALANSGEADRLELAVQSWSALRSQAAIELLPQLLANPHVQSDQRVRLIRSLGRYQVVSPRALLAIFGSLLAQTPQDREVWLVVIDVMRTQYGKRVGGFVRLAAVLMP